ncbi:MAG: acyl-CoA dehydrogenase family protein [Acidimicrobiales bacterium]
MCQHAVEFHGGSGAMLEVGIEKSLRDARINRHADGATDVSHFQVVKAPFPTTAGTSAAVGG